MSTGVGVSECCLSGKVQTGKPTGTVEEIGTLKTYVSAPENNSKAKVVIFITDIFGYEFPNVRLLADNYAKEGFFALIPDLHEGDSLPKEFLQDVEPPLPVRENLSLVEKTTKTAKVGATLGPWLREHREAVSKPLMDGFIQAVRYLPGVDKVGVIGFCWGGRYAILQAHGRKEGQIGGVDAAYACHPSLLAIPADISPVSKPTAVAVGEKDSLLDLKTVDQIKEALEKTGVPTEVKVYQNQVHGFALRSDWSSDEDKKAMDDAEKQGIEWFKKYLS